MKNWQTLHIPMRNFITVIDGSDVQRFDTTTVPALADFISFILTSANAQSKEYRLISLYNNKSIEVLLDNESFVNLEWTKVDSAKVSDFIHSLPQSAAQKEVLQPHTVPDTERDEKPFKLINQQTIPNYNAELIERKTQQRRAKFPTSKS